MASFSFNAADVAPAETFDVIPAGEYHGQVIASDLRATKSGTGQYIWLEQEILDGQYKGRKLWTTLNIINSNATAVDIAARQLSALCHAVGEIDVSDTDQLHFKPMLMVVKVVPKTEQYAAKNEVSGYKPGPGMVAVSKPSAPAQPARPPVGQYTQAPPVAVAAVAKVAPWNRAKVA